MAEQKFILTPNLKDVIKGRIVTSPEDAAIQSYSIELNIDGQSALAASSYKKPVRDAKAIAVLNAIFGKSAKIVREIYDRQKTCQVGNVRSREQFGMRGASKGK
jgi:hypothetical protein